MVERQTKRVHRVATVLFTIHTSSNFLFFYILAPPGQLQESNCSKKVLFSISLVVKFGDFNYDEKVIDDSTYIVGIYVPAVIGRLYTFHGVGLLFYPWNR